MFLSFCRVLLLGQSQVGKSSLCAQFMSSDHVNTYLRVGESTYQPEEFPYFSYFSGKYFQFQGRREGYKVLKDIVYVYAANILYYVFFHLKLFLLQRTVWARRWACLWTETRPEWSLSTTRTGRCPWRTSSQHIVLMDSWLFSPLTTRVHSHKQITFWRISSWSWAINPASWWPIKQISSGTELFAPPVNPSTLHGTTKLVTFPFIELERQWNIFNLLQNVRTTK